MNLSICVPTYNRNTRLKECFQSLLRFKNQEFELIVGDNGSVDGTQDVAQEYSKKFKHFTYVRHEENIGFARNMDSILRRASRKYIYVLSDDDTLLEDAMHIGMGLLEQNLNLVAVVGTYLSVRHIQEHYQPDFSDAVATIVRQNDFTSLIENLQLCDGHPIMRRSIFQTRCAYLERTGALIPLYFTLLNHGSIIQIDKPFFQHRTSSESLTGRMSESWFLDMANADLELAVCYSNNFLSQETLERHRAKLLKLLYFQAVRMAFSKKQFYVVWLFLMRLRGIGGGSELLFLKIEKEFIQELLFDQVKQLVRDSECKKVSYINHPLLRLIADWIKKKLPDLEVRLDEDGLEEDYDTIYLCSGNGDQIDVVNGNILPRRIDVTDVFSRLRLTDHHAQLQADEASITIEYASREISEFVKQPSQEFVFITAPYSEL
jgi:glycosyltransferase involved in cell wall biosynthesis